MLEGTSWRGHSPVKSRLPPDPGAQIQERLTQLLQARDALHLSWQRKKVYLDQLLDLHFFLRDAKQLDTLSAQQEVGPPLMPRLASIPSIGSALQGVHRPRKTLTFPGKLPYLLAE
ncbi:hypothetical protein HPB47_021672 [Ixodes persulcatus]|uniref:Uncharacterized protein n=1 Tax=Ixodes persulcatus TaxID=34615 RepID=A0AC60QBX0_IXOPE|nr:hypothetical protein HPB47_021672 [Ixodes persulcatus]